MQSFVGQSSFTGKNDSMWSLKGDSSNFASEGFCKLQSQEQTRVFRYNFHQSEKNEVSLPERHARQIGVWQGQQVKVERYSKLSGRHNIDVLYLKLSASSQCAVKLQQWSQAIKEKCLESSLPLNANFDYDFSDRNASMTVQTTSLCSKVPETVGFKALQFGFLTKDTQVLIQVPENLGIQVEEDSESTQTGVQQSLLDVRNLSFSELGIGGHNKMFGEILELVLVPRLLSVEHMRLLQMEPSRGFILEGPPGTGKTLIASKLGELLKAHVKIVRGPEMVTKYVGQGAELVRDLFREAFEDWNSYGANSPLHVILIDEIDSLCPQRGSNQSVDGGATDQIVGTFLTMIQGVSAADNFVIVGTTNRVQAIDEALLRDGRLSRTFHVDYPDKVGREQIWIIHLRTQIDSGIVDAEMIPELVEASEGFSGAMIKGCVTSAILSYVASHRKEDRTSVAEVVSDAVSLSEKLKAGSFKLSRNHMIQAIRETRDRMKLD